MSLKVPRSKKGKVTSNSNNAFNSSILLLEYEGEEEKPETKPNDKKDSNSEEEDQEVVQVLNSCMRVITEDTEHSSHPNSARFTPQASTPESMTMEINPMMMQMIYPPDYYYQMQRQSPTPTVRNRRAITNEESKEYVINLDNVGRDGRTTIMVRNIPNKYTQEMLLSIFEKNHKKKFDFFYLPIDYNVLIFLLRIAAMWATPSSTLLTQGSSVNSTKSSIRRSGTDSTQAKSARFATPESKELSNSRTTSSTQM